MRTARRRAQDLTPTRYRAALRRHSLRSVLPSGRIKRFRDDSYSVSPVLRADGTIDRRATLAHAIQVFEARVRKVAL